MEDYYVLADSILEEQEDTIPNVHVELDEYPTLWRHGAEPYW